MTPFPSTVYRSLAAVLILLTLPACRDNTESLWQDYSARLERVTAQNFIAPDYRPEVDQNLNAANRPEALEARLPLLESLGLMHCRLGELIATHNSSLGRVAEPSELLKYQLAFIQAAPICLIDARLESQTKQLLTEALLQKQQDALDWFDWMLLQDRALDKLLFIGTESLSSESPLAGLIETELALAALVKLKTDIMKAQVGQLSWQALDTQTLDAALAELARSRIIARNMRSQTVSLLWLSSLNDWLEPRLDGLLCRPGHNNQRQEILQRILVKNFIGQIQRQLSQSRHIQRRLGDLLQQLYQGTAVESRVAYFFAETANKDSLNIRLDKELKRHVNWWQKLRDSCSGTAPGA
ncbi:DUF3080 family protein [Shewanella algae]|uniref:DUF3080 family protein n=1 Tax=Shewanella algae TaxID=38313 RepID=UPI001AACD761|nr:DUF3080 family protein [Shewanella algae]MBO2569600.1 DUF3080 family protein [Shewanella algae]